MKFIEESIKIQKLLGLNPKRPEYEKIEYNRYISSNGETLIKLKEAIDKRGIEVLGIAPTGGGKTYTIDLLFKSINQRRDDILKEFQSDKHLWKATGGAAIRHFLSMEKKNLNMLACPNRIQNLQNEHDYTMNALVGNSKGIEMYDLNIDNNFSFVFDKAKEIREYIEALEEDINLNLVIDEAQLLVDNANFRSCLIELEKLIQVVLGKNGSVIYITGTPDSLKCKQFDKIIEFVDKNYKAPADKLEIVLNQSNSTMADFCYQELKKVSKPFFRLNSFGLTEDIILPSTILDGKTILTVDSTKKDYITIKDVTGKEQIIYDSKLFGSIVEKGELPTSTTINGVETPVDGYGATSVLEVGTNISSVGGKEDNTLTPTYICQNPRNMSINSIIQFFNRVRFHVDKYVLLMPGKEHKDIVPLEEIVKKEQKKRDAYISSYNKMVAAYKTIAIDDADLISTINKFMNNDIRKDGTSANLGYLYFDEDSLEVKSFSYGFWNACYSKFISQYFYNVEGLVSILKEKLNIQIEVRKVNKVENTCCQVISKAKDYFSSISIDENLENEIKNNKVTDKELSKYTTLPLYKEALNLNNMGIPMEKAFHMVGTLSPKALSLEKFNKCQEIIKGLTTLEYEKLVMVCKKEIDIDDIKDDAVKKAISIILSNKDIKRFLKKMLELEIDSKDIKKYIIKAKKINDLNKFMYESLVHIHIKNYVENKVFMLAGNTGIECKIIMDRLYKINDNGNLIQTTITPEILSFLQQEIEKELDNIYEEKDILEMIKTIFKVRKKDKKMYIKEIR